MLEEYKSKFKGVDLTKPVKVLERALELYHPKIVLASSFSLEDVSLIHMMKEIVDEPEIFALDTGRLNDETYSCAEQIQEKYQVEIDWYFPQRESVEELIRKKGLYSFKTSVENRKECCGIRKVEPLNRALEGFDGWITGLRKAQSVTRDELDVIESDAGHGGILKLNPLAAWSFDDTFAFVKKHGIPYNSLYDKGFRSIGCAPCTRPIKIGEHERDGRWWWENPEHKECGLHLGAGI